MQASHDFVNVIGFASNVVAVLDTFNTLFVSNSLVKTAYNDILIRAHDSAQFAT